MKLSKKPKKKREPVLKQIKDTFRYIRLHPSLYLMLIPGLVLLAIFEFLPYYGITIAFKDYNIFAADNPLSAIAASEWVGFQQFTKLFGSSDFMRVLKNTIVINGLRIIILFPIPIIVAILLREVRSKKLMSITQTAIYIPYFFSWAVISGIFTSLLGSYGVVNTVVTKLGFDRIGFFQDPEIFRGVLLFTDGWKSVGYNVVLFMATLVAISPELYESAKIDGANKYQEIFYITLPSILPTIVMVLILRVGNLLTKGFEQILVLYNPAVYDSADIIGTYVYRMGIGRMDFSRSAALGLFNSVVSAILVISTNYISKKLVKRSLW